MRALERIHRDKDIAIAVECPPDARFQGERQDLEEMLGNLLDNACKWARGNGVGRGRRRPPTQAAAARPARHHASTTTGRGSPTDERARIGKRGLRLDETKPGSGLGLSIVTDLAQSYRRPAAAGPVAPAAACACELDLPAA